MSTTSLLNSDFTSRTSIATSTKTELANINTKILAKLADSKKKREEEAKGKAARDNQQKEVALAEQIKYAVAAKHTKDVTYKTASAKPAVIDITPDAEGVMQEGIMSYETDQDGFPITTRMRMQFETESIDDIKKREEAERMAEYERRANLALAIRNAKIQSALTKLKEKQGAIKTKRDAIKYLQARENITGTKIGNMSLASTKLVLQNKRSAALEGLFSKKIAEGSALNCPYGKIATGANVVSTEDMLKQMDLEEKNELSYLMTDAGKEALFEEGKGLYPEPIYGGEDLSFEDINDAYMDEYLDSMDAETLASMSYGDMFGTGFSMMGNKLANGEILGAMSAAGSLTEACATAIVKDLCLDGAMDTLLSFADNTGEFLNDYIFSTNLLGMAATVATNPSAASSYISLVTKHGGDLGKLTGKLPTDTVLGKFTKDFTDTGFFASKTRTILNGTTSLTDIAKISNNCGSILCDAAVGDNQRSKMLMSLGKTSYGLGNDAYEGKFGFNTTTISRLTPYGSKVSRLADQNAKLQQSAIDVLIARDEGLVSSSEDGDAIQVNYVDHGAILNTVPSLAPESTLPPDIKTEAIDSIDGNLGYGVDVENMV